MPRCALAEKCRLLDFEEEVARKKGYNRTQGASGMPTNIISLNMEASTPYSAGVSHRPITMVKRTLDILATCEAAISRMLCRRRWSGGFMMKIVCQMSEVRGQRDCKSVVGASVGGSWRKTPWEYSVPIKLVGYLGLLQPHVHQATNSSSFIV